MKSLTNKDVSLIGMVHVRALPGTPEHNLPMKEIRRIAVSEARALRNAGFDALLVENMHDVPYLKRDVGPEIVAAMTSVTDAVRQAVDCPLGVQILAGANRQALAVALTAGAQFIRAEGFIFAHVADEGLMESDAAELLRYRRLIGAEDILIFADIKKKHSSHTITADVSLADTAHAAEFFGADALVITGTATGRPASASDLDEAARGSRLPLLVGSGTTPANLPELWHRAQGFIIGSCIKKGGRWENPLDKRRIAAIIRAAEKLRLSHPHS